MPVPGCTWPPLMADNPCSWNLPAVWLEKTGSCVKNMKQSMPSPSRWQNKSGQPAFDKQMGKKTTYPFWGSNKVISKRFQHEMFPYFLLLEKGRKEGNLVLIQHLLCARCYSWELSFLFQENMLFYSRSVPLNWSSTICAGKACECVHVCGGACSWYS